MRIITVVVGIVGSVGLMGLVGIAGVLSSSAFAQTPKDLTANFEYELKLSVDANKRTAYLKKMNEQPSPYEKVFTVLSGSVQVANVVDQVKFTGGTFKSRL